MQPAEKKNSQGMLVLLYMHIRPYSDDSQCFYEAVELEYMVGLPILYVNLDTVLIRFECENKLYIPFLNH